MIFSTPSRRVRLRWEVAACHLTCKGAREPARMSTLTRHPGTRCRNPVATQKCWYVTEALVNEHGRTMGCPRCTSGIGTHNAECRGRIEGTLLQQSRMKPKQEEETRGGRTTTKPVPMEPEKPTGPATQHGSSSDQVFSERCLQYYGDASR